MNMAKDNMAQREQASGQPERRSRWCHYRWFLLSFACAVFLIVMGLTGPGEPLDGVILWTGIAAAVWTVGQSAYSAISIWCIRVGTEQYFDAVCNGRWLYPGEQVAMADYWKWCRAQGWHFWWRVMRKNHRV